jgi:hypothetical protein
MHIDYSPEARNDGAGTFSYGKTESGSQNYNGKNQDKQPFKYFIH